MELRETFPFWDQLSAAQQALITQRAVLREVPAGAVLSGAGTDCVGLLVLRSGRLRAYVLSQDGREVTLYRLTAGEICLFSASCVLGTAQMDLTVEAEQDSTVWVFPPDVFRQIAHESAAAAGYVNSLMARRFSEVMWLVEQVMWQSMDRRLAAFLLEESYYTTDGKTHASPHLFLFTEEADGSVKLSSYEMPQGYTAETLTYDRLDAVDYASLVPSAKFTPAIYHRKDGVWEGGSVSMFTPVLKFTLWERFSEAELEVQETMEVNGKRTFGYDAPIRYQRKDCGEAGSF